MNRSNILVILGTVIVVALVLAVSNFNIGLNVKGKEDKAATNQQINQTSQADPMADHHGGTASVDAAVFSGLVGKIAPDFTLESFDGKKIILSELKGKNVILFFNEGLMCYPACWNQIAAFGGDVELNSKSVILNITADPKKDWKQAIDKMPELSLAKVLFDSDRRVSNTYGVLTLDSSMHKGQFPGHSYVIIDKEGVIRFAKDDIAMAVRNKDLALELEKIN